MGTPALAEAADAEDTIAEQDGVKLVGYWLAFPQHTTYLVVETDSVEHLHQFLKPGAAVTVSEITPVTDQPVPPPA